MNHPHDAYAFTVMIDPTRAWWLRDDTAEENFPVGQTDLLDGWQPMHGSAPLSPTITLHLPASRASDYMSLTVQDQTLSFYGLSGLDPGATQTYETFHGVDEMADYVLPILSGTFTNPRPYESGPFSLQDTTAGDGTSLWAGENDLRRWLPPVQPLQLNLSGSRWEHELMLRHADGTAYPIIKHQTQGNTSFTPQGNAWQNSYYYFDATADYHPELPFYLEDASTGERLGPNPTNTELINWIAFADAKNLTATGQPDGTFLLTWIFAETSTEGAFLLERRAKPAANWELISTIPANASLNTYTGTAQASRELARSEFAEKAEIRITYEYGGHRSVPSNTVALPYQDSDDDGLPDWWETKYGFGKNNPADADDDPDLDGF